MPAVVERSLKQTYSGEKNIWRTLSLVDVISPIGPCSDPRYELTMTGHCTPSDRTWWWGWSQHGVFLKIHKTLVWVYCHQEWIFDHAKARLWKVIWTLSVCPVSICSHSSVCDISPALRSKAPHPILSGRNRVFACKPPLSSTSIALYSSESA